MELLSPALLVLLFGVSGLCSTSATRSYDHRQPLLANIKTHLVRQSKFHKFKRQVEDNHCDALAREVFCTNGFYNGYANVLQRCNYSESATYFQDICTPNSMGRFCIADTYTLQKDFESACDSSNSTCNSECRDVLVSIRSEEGCCIASIYNDSSKIWFYSPEPFSYTLWSNCGVEPVTQACPPSTITLTQTEPDPTCSGNLTSTLQLLYSTICRRQYIDSFVMQLTAQGCSDLFGFDSLCRANKFGTYCDTVEYDQFDFLFDAASVSCSDTSTCDLPCMEALNNITNTVGCCFIERYNNTRTYNHWLSDEFWSMCNIIYPGLCENRFVDHNEGKKYHLKYSSVDPH